MKEISIIIVSFNTEALLRKCLQTAVQEAKNLDHEIIVIDNASRDGSAVMVEKEFPLVRLVKSEKNLGFAGGNNVGFKMARGKFVVLLNSDAFPKPGAFEKALEKMDKNLFAGIGGAKLMAENDFVQPAARMFPSVLNEFLLISGLADKFPRSHFFGKTDRTWADPNEPAQCDWVPGAFTIIRKKVLAQIGDFDSRFFLYFEEVDFCRRAKIAGWQVWYWPEIEVTHLGGESSKTLKELDLSGTGSQLELWRMRSQFLFYRKNHGLLAAWFSMLTERLWYQIRDCKNSLAGNFSKANESKRIVTLLNQAWQETEGGQISPPKPW